MTGLPRSTILIGDAADRLRELPDASVDCVITSPPYFQLRDYGMGKRQIGLEPTVTAWVDRLQSVLHEVARVLKPTGSLWLNLADSYSRAPRYGAPPKGLLLGPERLLLALAGDGWTVRNKVIWAKPNPMPHSVGDRLNTSYDVVYFLVRSRHYYFDLDRIRVPHISPTKARGSGRTSPASQRPPAWAGPLAGNQSGLRRARPDGVPGHWLGKNPGDVWTIATASFHGAHFATFPEALVEQPLLVTCPEAICTACDQPWRRRITMRRQGTISPAGRHSQVRRYPGRWRTFRQIGDLQPCDCGALTRPGVVLDPFFGTGTVGAVAERFGRDWLGIELSPAYAELARKRLAAIQPASGQAIAA
ncbi:MAG: hypothetical protein QOH36_1270 [Actinomycetota bacterium]|nr:hypothetical protein [Actinomycetota bacterium]